MYIRLYIYKQMKAKVQNLLRKNFLEKERERVDHAVAKIKYNLESNPSPGEVQVESNTKAKANSASLLASCFGSDDCVQLKFWDGDDAKTYAYITTLLSVVIMIAVHGQNIQHELETWGSASSAACPPFLATRSCCRRLLVTRFVGNARTSQPHSVLAPPPFSSVTAKSPA